MADYWEMASGFVRSVSSDDSSSDGFVVDSSEGSVAVLSQEDDSCSCGPEGLPSKDDGFDGG